MQMDMKSFKSGLSKQQKSLLKAVEQGTLVQVQDTFPRCRNLDGNKELFNYILVVSALHRGHKSISKFLIKNACKLKLTVKTNYYCTPLYYAVKLEDIDLCRDLCKREASIHDKDANEESALELIMLQGSHTQYFLKYYLKQAITRLEPNPNNEDDVALFHATCFFGFREISTFISDFKFSPSARSRFINEKWRNYTVMHFLVEKNADPDLFTRLLSHRDTNAFAQDGSGCTPLHLAFRYRSSSHDLTYSYVSNLDDNMIMNPVDVKGLSHFHIICSLKYYKGNYFYGKYLNILKGLMYSIEDINTPVSVEDEEYPGYTALHFAVRYSKSYVVKLLLENGANPSRIDSVGRTPLHIALNHSKFSELDEEHREIIELLLKHDADVDARDAQDCTPLHLVFWMREYNEKLFQTFLSKSQFDINLTECSGFSYFHIACSEGDIERIETHLKEGAMIDSHIQHEDKSELIKKVLEHRGYSALHFAIKFKRVKIVEYLLSHGANVNVNLGFTTPLHVACSNDLETQSNYLNPHQSPDFDWSSNRDDGIRIIKLLLKHDASVNVEDARGYTPLMNACSIPLDLNVIVNRSNYSILLRSNYFDSLLKEISKRQEIVLDILLLHGADVNSQNNFKESILHLFAKHYEACPSGKKWAEIVLKKGGNLNVANSVGATPLHIAVEESMTKNLGSSLIKLYIKYGANINAKTEKLETPLHLAVECFSIDEGNQGIIRALLYSQKIEVNSQNINGDTPLHIAVHQQKCFCVSELLRLESDINLKNNLGYTPIKIAYQWSNRYFYENETVLENIQFEMITHVQRLMVMKRFISDEVRAVFESLALYFPTKSAKFDEELTIEVERLKCRKIDQYTSLYDILLKDFEDMAHHAKNPKLVEVVSPLENGDYDFPLFNDMLLNRVERGKIRDSVLRLARKVLKLITKLSWPDYCADHILQYLSNSNLEALIESVDFAEICKRPH